jgi:fermentation-respiration switch protein FrsA (DUF1100 family)
MKAFPSTKISPLFSTYPGGVQLYYPTAPIRLQPADIPGFTPSQVEGDGYDNPDAWGWFRRETGGGLYIGLEDGLQTILNSIKEAGGVDGIIGFSQGAAVAAFVASLLEAGRIEAFEKVRAEEPTAYEFPESWKKLQVKVQQDGGVKFAVSYSGFWAPHPSYAAFYEPKIATPLLSVIGSLDSVVEEHRSTDLVDRCVGKKVVYHPGGHFVPIGKEMVGVLIGWIKECCTEKKEETPAEDMDLPF